MFAIVSLRQALANEVSCGCFGDVPIRPWWILLFDMLALVGLLLASPSHAPTIRSHPLRFRAALATGLAFGVAAGLAIPWQGAPPIAVIPDPVDLGEIQAGGTASAIIRLDNRADVPIRLAAIETTCECLTLERTGDVIGPAEAAVATVTLDLKQKPAFHGRLRIELVGKDTDGRIAFTLVVLAHVTRIRTAAAAGSGTPRAPCRS